MESVNEIRAYIDVDDLSTERKPSERSDSVEPGGNNRRKCESSSSYKYIRKIAAKEALRNDSLAEIRVE